MILLRRIFTVMLGATLLTAAFGLRAVHASTPQEAHGAKVRATILKRDARRRVEIKLMNDSKLRGHISNIGGDTFTVTDRKTGASNTIAFADVKKVSGPTMFSSQTKWIITASALTAGAVALYMVRGAFCDGQC